MNHYMLMWQYQWQGAALQNLRILVCPDCYDKPQEQLRTIVLPADPQPILNPRPEFFASDDNPLSVNGWDVANLSGFAAVLGTQSGNFLNPTAAFDGRLNKPFVQCAQLSISNSSFQNTLTMNWTGPNSYNGQPYPTQQYALNSFTIIAPNDHPFLNSGPTGYQLNGSNDGVVFFTLFSGTTAGSPGETITVNQTSFTSNPLYAFHQVAFQGDGLNRIGVAQVQFTTTDVQSEEQ